MVSKLDMKWEATAGVVWYPKVAVTFLAACSSFLPAAAAAGEEALNTTLGVPVAVGSCMQLNCYTSMHDDAEHGGAEIDDANDDAEHVVAKHSVAKSDDVTIDDAIDDEAKHDMLDMLKLYTMTPDVMTLK